ncbi:unnamed protein product [Paramecium octaurelia]|uniref:Uncharacterized protein n=1 Tax=Paramecium octaurelia TaxID=43137 RepID=A0A8S1UE07_PAROT|nr:unnamed protein product [Paramecium octaurelia]
MKIVIKFFQFLFIQQSTQVEKNWKKYLSINLPLKFNLKPEQTHMHIHKVDYKLPKKTLFFQGPNSD